ncbi:hypothetical protein M9Y10_039851 [Tritrichomonas musculus]|uniref:galactinol--sucrose galactosyltransferase n=1 Tax=Tritrichomonas musculus TaxID=1915356 RepID=A0ABR2GQJ8_9EUKA
MLAQDKIRLQVNCIKGTHHELTCSLNAGPIEKNGLSYELKETEVDGCKLVSLKLVANQSVFNDNLNLSLENPLRFYLPVTEKPQKITTLYLFKDWWTRPAFVDKYEDIPARTQVAYFKYPNKVVCLIPMVGNEFKSNLNGGTDKEIGLDMFSLVGGHSVVDDPVYLLSEAPTYIEAVHKAFTWLAKSKNIFTREQRRYPEMFEYLGWCSWDAMKTDVNEVGIREKADEFCTKKVPIRWMLIDDGWFPGKDMMVRGFAPDTKKFPHGFKHMIEDIKKKSNVRWFGVWHALMGYWSGIDPECELATTEAPYLYKTTKGYLIPSPKNGSQFYYHWNEVLRKEGIDFLKVDGQSSCNVYFEGTMPIPEAARCMNRELELGASLMNGVIINCMGMAMENVLGRPTSSMSRNSDDFFPDQKGSFVEHLLENAYNATYHDEIYYCDWDMFWTKHEAAVKHSMLRAISGGPIYFSDKVGNTIPEVLSPLVYSDGKILRMDRSAKPTEDCLFIDPLKEGVLKLHNVTSWGQKKKGGIISAYNVSPSNQKVSFTPSDIPDIEKSDRYWIYNFIKKNVVSLGKNEAFSDDIESGGFGWYVILPETGNIDCFGLIDKYVCFQAVENITENGNTQTVVLHATGTVGWASKKAAKKVVLNGSDVTKDVKQNGEFFTLNIPENDAKAVLTFEW